MDIVEPVGFADRTDYKGLSVHLPTMDGAVYQRLIYKKT
jgi:hypothetical protein